jgi:hypothetical protein
MTELKPCTCAVNEGCSDECDRGTTFWEKAISEARELKPSSRGNVLDYVENRCRELRPRPAPDDGRWMPIETAPKDGKLILIREKRGRIQVAKWCAPGYDSPDWYVQISQIGTDSYPASDVTHWIPLPPQPEQE